MEVLGGKFATADERLCRRLEIRGGVEVLAIKADGILSKARVRPGFVITHINDKSVRSLSDMQRMTDKVRSIDGVYRRRTFGELCACRIGKRQESRVCFTVFYCRSLRTFL